MSRIDGFAIVTAKGELKRGYKRTAPRIYLNRHVAERMAAAPGDSVVAVSVDLDVPPLFIRGQKVVPA